MRMLNRSRSFTDVAVLTLALGVATTTTIFSVVNAVLLRALPYSAPDRLVVLWERDPQKGLEHERVTPADFVDWRVQNQVFENLAFSPAWPGSRAVNFVGNDGSEKIPGAFVSSAFFPVLGVKPILGRTFISEEDQPESSPVAVLSYPLWQRRFRGDSHVLGETVGIDIYGFRRYAVIGVMPPGFRFPDQTEIWLPAGYMGVRVPAPGSTDRCCPWLQVFGRLKPGVTLSQAQSHLSTIARRIAEQHPQNRFGSDAKVVPLLEQMVGSARSALMVLLGAADCLRQCGQSIAFSRHRPPERIRCSHGPRGDTRTSHSTATYRKSPPGFAGRGARYAFGCLGPTSGSGDRGR
jgi:putative ABC transport system permease protein